MFSPEPLSVRLVRLDGRLAVLKSLETDQPELRIGRQHLPKGSGVGDAFIIEVIPAAEAALHRDVVARKLLEDILNGR